jgi:hypothetical protein
MFHWYRLNIINLLFRAATADVKNFVHKCSLLKIMIVLPLTIPLPQPGIIFRICLAAYTKLYG